MRIKSALRKPSFLADLGNASRRKPLDLEEFGSGSNECIAIQGVLLLRNLHSVSFLFTEFL